LENFFAFIEFQNSSEELPSRLFVKSNGVLILQKKLSFGEGDSDKYPKRIFNEVIHRNLTTTLL
jgi:hypothetical protein